MDTEFKSVMEAEGISFFAQPSSNCFPLSHLLTIIATPGKLNSGRPGFNFALFRWSIKHNSYFPVKFLFEASDTLIKYFILPYFLEYFKLDIPGYTVVRKRSGT